MNRDRRAWYVHTIVFGLGQGLLWRLGESMTDADRLLLTADRVWLALFILHTIWAWALAGRLNRGRG
ncbi:hypothetical protein ACIBF1_02615 [Spirillospora sp. NPDC050679]